MDSIEVQVPIWVLKQMVERDHETWAFYNETDVEIEGWQSITTFPEYDSTAKALEVLENHGLLFDKETGKWIE